MSSLCQRRVGVTSTETAPGSSHGSESASRMLVHRLALNDAPETIDCVPLD